MIKKPTLLLDEEKCRVNIQMMAEKAKRHELEFRPHFKTNQSLEIGRWFKDYGVNKITVSSFEMAEYFSPEWKDITVAFPVNILEIDTINSLAKRINLNLLLESVETISFLKENLNSKAGFFIKIDTGYNRTGIDPSNKNLINEILKISLLAENLSFKGFLVHCGHTYHAKSVKEINEIHEQSLKQMNELKNCYKKDFPDLLISIGDTPSCSISENFAGVDEIRPGNFIFYDLMQLHIGSCTIDQISVAMACPVVAIHKDRNEIIIYGGAVHFSKEGLKDDKDGIIYGRAAEIQNNGWGNFIDGMYVKSLSQEHGIVKIPPSLISDYKVGDIIYILPVHSCLTMDTMKNFITINPTS